MLSSIRMQATDNGTQPLWAVDLRPFSYSSRPNPHYIGGKAYIGGKFVDIGVLFPTSDEVICYFVTKADAGQLVRRNELTPTDPFVLQFVAFDAKTGALKFRKQLPTRSGISSVMMNDEGNFIVRNGDFLRLYSPDFKVLRERKLEGVKKYDYWELRLSPTGRTLLLKHYIPSNTHIEILRSSSLSPLGSGLDRALSFRFAISDDSLATAEESTRGLLRKFVEPWRVIWEGKSHLCLPTPAFVTNTELLTLCWYELTVVNTKGQIIMQDRLEGGKKESLEELTSVTRDGKFFAVSAEQEKGGFMDLTDIRRSRTRILIYDTNLRKRISSVQVVPIPKADYDFALSRDGSKLAVMIDDHLNIYDTGAAEKPTEHSRQPPSSASTLVIRKR